MPNAIVKNVFAVLFLVVLCFIIGGQAAESAVSSVGILAAIIGSVILLWLGPRCWGGIYILPPVLALLPLPGKLALLPVGFIVGFGILCYWTMMWVMGYVKFKWRGLLVMDVLVLVMFAYMVASFLRHPVSINMLGLDVEYVGGKEYAWCVLAVLYYVAVSSIPCTYEQVSRVMKWAIRSTLFFSIVAVVLRLVGIRGNLGAESIGEAVEGTRFAWFAPIGLYCIYIIYGQKSMLKILMSPGLIIGIAFSLLAILISGWREKLMASCFIITALAFIKRELWCLVLMLAMAYGGVLFLSTEGLVKQMPYGIQRCLSVVPGVEIEEYIRGETEHSTDWRVEMWGWAMDARYGYIQDYTWGDGFGQSVDWLRRDATAMMRGELLLGDQERFAATGTWHSGIITSIHRLGYIGLAIISLIYLYGTYMMFRVCFLWKNTNLYLPALFFVLPYAAEPSLFYISEGTIPKFFRTYMYLATIKLFYCLAKEKGLVKPWLFRRHYVPQVIREYGNELQPGH